MSADDDRPEYREAEVVDTSPRDGSGGDVPFPAEGGEVVRLYPGPYGYYTALTPGGQHWGPWRFRYLDGRGANLQAPLP